MLLEIVLYHTKPSLVCILFLLRMNLPVHEEFLCILLLDLHEEYIFYIELMERPVKKYVAIESRTLIEFIFPTGANVSSQSIP
jgi:hypothetical protein